jgi:hypothetical protein
MTDMYTFNSTDFWDILGGKTVTFDWIVDKPFELTGAIPLITERITCVQKDPSGNISALGGTTEDGKRWILSSSEMVSMIEEGTPFRVEEPVGDPVKVVVATRDGNKFLKTERLEINLTIYCH